MTVQGLEPTTMAPEEVRRYTQEETKRWTRLIKAAGIKPTD
jgi:tripartite-type tricarboxylate transporter receptor subunit TctC